MFRSGPPQALSGFRGGSKPQIVDLSPDLGDRALQLEADHRGGDTLLDQGNQGLDSLIVQWDSVGFMNTSRYVPRFPKR
jgi:hypothetical protein